MCHISFSIHLLTNTQAIFLSPLHLQTFTQMVAYARPSLPLLFSLQLQLCVCYHIRRALWFLCYGCIVFQGVAVSESMYPFPCEWTFGMCSSFCDYRRCCRTWPSCRVSRCPFLKYKCPEAVPLPKHKKAGLWVQYLGGNSACPSSPFPAQLQGCSRAGWDAWSRRGERQGHSTE